MLVSKFKPSFDGHVIPYFTCSVSPLFSGVQVQLFIICLSMCTWLCVILCCIYTIVQLLFQRCSEKATSILCNSMQGLILKILLLHDFLPNNQVFRCSQCTCNCGKKFAILCSYLYSLSFLCCRRVFQSVSAEKEEKMSSGGQVSKLYQLQKRAFCTYYA